MRALGLALFSVFLVAVGCGNRMTPEGGDAGGARRCAINAECDDGIACTVDVCGVDMRCAYTPVDAVCTGPGERCVVGVGCTAERRCTASAECDDGIVCTVDSCSAGNVCTYTPVDALCTDPARPRCDAAMGCVAGGPMRCTSSAQCDDGVGCTVDLCTSSGACQNMPVDSMCDTAAGEICTRTGCMRPMSCDDDEDCQDGNFCNGRERCVPELGCAPATTMPRCNDGDPCTRDSCNPDRGCEYVCDPTMAGCSCGGEINCTGRFAIAPAPMDNCASGMVDYSLSSVEITISGGQTLVDPAPPARASFGTMTDPIARCPRVQAQARVEGMIPEVFSVDLTFENSDRFTGTFTASYGGFGILGGCREGPVSIVGTRMP